MPTNLLLLRSFVLQGLQAIGATPEEITREIYQVTLPPDAQRIFANQKQLLFTFQREAQFDYPDAELVTIGGNLLNHLIDVLRKRAQAATVMLISRDPLPPAQFPCPLPLMGCWATNASVIVGHAPLTNFLIKTTYLTDEKIEQLFEVTIDQATGHLELNSDEFGKLLHQPLKTGRPSEHIFAQIDEAAALRQAFDAVQPTVRQRSQAIEATVSRHLDEELARIRAYYASTVSGARPLDNESADMLSAEEIAEMKAKQERQREEQQQLEAERDHKLDMARERYRLVVRTSLLEAITIFRPQHRYTFQINADRSASPGAWLPLIIDVDPSSGAHRLPTCGSCGGSMAQVCYCERKPHLVCQACVQVCTSCGHGRCSEHSLVACSVDGASVCDTCLNEAEDCGHHTCPDHRLRCAVSNKAVCVTCARTCFGCGQSICPSHTLACHIDQTPLCVNCVVRCARCNEATCAKDQVHCRTCGEISCSACASRCSDPNCRRYHCNIHLQTCATPGCTGRFCSSCVKPCAQCGRSHCLTHTLTCHECKQSVGNGCAALCASHGHPLCHKHALPCNVCNQLACPQGLTNCHSCGRATCSKHTQVCNIDRQPLCPSCSGACTTCNAIHCVGNHLTTCSDCGRRHCPAHIVACHVDGKFFCIQHQAVCAICGQHHCLQHTHTCDLCNQPICSTCLSAKGICQLCASLQSIPANDPRILQAHPAINAAGVRPKSVSAWLIAETSGRRIIVARMLLRHHLFVFRPSDGAPQAHRSFSLLQSNLFPSP
ncbi:MAG TPA: hypothetical protein VKT82_12735 [Ktedonobacterales bacterium]|nr:hypothetical protein [Ktedonobacterales bacterium]